MNNKIIGISLNNQFGILQAQEMEFVTDTDKLIHLKGTVGAGKSSINNAISLGLSGGSARALPPNIDLRAYDGADVEEQILIGDIPVFVNTTLSGTSLTSTVYIKDEKGKKKKNPTINGKKFTPAALRDYLRTELTFGVDNFVSNDHRVQNEWVMRVYKDKLEAYGVIFDTTSPKYKGSILYRLEQAKAERSNLYNKVSELNAYKTRLEDEGYDEKNIPNTIDISKIEDNHKKLVKDYYEEKAALEKQISDISLEVAKKNAIIDSYNQSLSTKKELERKNAIAEIDKYNRGVDDKIEKRNIILSAAKTLIDNNFTGIQEQVDKLELLPSKRVFNPDTIRVNRISQDEKGRYIRDGKYIDEVEKAFDDIESLRKKAIPLFNKKKDIAEPTDDYLKDIDNAKAINRIALRWATFYEHQDADKKVKDIFKEYKKIFTNIDMGVDGLKMMLVGKDEESMDMRIMYNGSHDKDLFNNTNLAFRPVSSYSETQKNILAILVQVYLLEEKKKRGEEGLRYLFIDAPIDNKTKDILIQLQKRYDLQLMTTCTGDFDKQNLKDGEILIENGYLITNNKVKNEKEN